MATTDYPPEPKLSPKKMAEQFFNMTAGEQATFFSNIKSFDNNPNAEPEFDLQLHDIVTSKSLSAEGFNFLIKLGKYAKAIHKQLITKRIKGD